MKDTDTCSIDEKEWKTALKEVRGVKDMPDGKTVAELREIWGKGKPLARSTTSIKIKQLLIAGLAEQGEKDIVDSMDRIQRVVAYRLKTKK